MTFQPRILLIVSLKTSLLSQLGCSRLDLVQGLLILLIILLFYHTHSGLQEVLEDYVHNEIIKAIVMVSMKFFVIGIAVASVLAVLRIALGA